MSSLGASSTPALRNALGGNLDGLGGASAKPIAGVPRLLLLLL